MLKPIGMDRGGYSPTLTPRGHAWQGGAPLGGLMVCLGVRFVGLDFGRGGAFLVTHGVLGLGIPWGK
jgi:hypothetical protein